MGIELLQSYSFGIIYSALRGLSYSLKHNPRAITCVLITVMMAFHVLSLNQSVVSSISHVRRNQVPCFYLSFTLGRMSSIHQVQYLSNSLLIFVWFVFFFSFLWLFAFILHCLCYFNPQKYKIKGGPWPSPGFVYTRVLTHVYKVFNPRIKTKTSKTPSLLCCLCCQHKS